MNALVKKTDSQRINSYFWIFGITKRDCWRQLDDLQDHATLCKTKAYFDIVIWEENGVAKDAYDGQIVPPDYIKDLISGKLNNI